MQQARKSRRLQHRVVGQSAYVAEHLYEKHGLTTSKMIEAAQELIGK